MPPNKRMQRARIVDRCVLGSAREPVRTLGTRMARKVCCCITPSRVAHYTGTRSPSPPKINPYAHRSSVLAASQMKAASSRATAVTATFLCLPRSISRRYLRVSRS